MSRMMWFGPRGYETWINMPRIDMDSVHAHVGQRADQIRGGVSIRQSAAGHQEYGMTWNPAKRDEIALIQDVIDGHYDSAEGSGLIHFLDPAAMDKNLLPRLWAAPYLCGLGAPSLTKATKPVLVDTGGTVHRLPSRSATFTTTTSATNHLQVYIPIPPGYTARVGFYGPTTQASKIRVRTVNGTFTGASTVLGVIVNASYGTGMTTFAAGVTRTGILIDLNPVAGSVSLTTGICQVYPTGQTPPTPTTFLSGRGHSGCQVEPGSLSSVVHNVYHDRASISARFVEVGSWL